MKKISSVLLCVILFGFSSAFAQDVQVVPTNVEIPYVETEWETQNQENQEEIVYNYYYSPTCGWCQKLDKFLDKNDAYEKLNINKINVREWNNVDKMMNAAQEVGINPSSVWTPFVTFGPSGTGSYIQGGYYGAAQHFAQQLNVEDPTAGVNLSQDEKSNRSLIVLILGLLIIVGPLAYLGLKK